MPLSVVPSFLFYTIVGAITPGPANISSLSAALRYGKKAALRQWRGIFCGYFVVSMASVLVSWLLGAALDEYVPYLSWVGALYILRLAWHTLQSSELELDQDPAAPTFKNGLLLQLTNVKVMVCCLTTLSSFILPYTRSLGVLLIVGIFLPFTGPIANLIWLFAGDKMKDLFSNHRKVVDRVMAVALVLCAISLVWPQ